MIPPTPEASGEPLSDAQIAELVRWAEMDAEDATDGDDSYPMLLAALRELQQRRAASLPAAQGADVAALARDWDRLADGMPDARADETGALRMCARELRAALDARLSPPQERKPFKLDVSKEWCMRMATLEEGHDVSAGSVPPPQGAPEASVDLEQIAQETAEKIADARPAFYFHQTGEVKYATPDMAAIILAALQRAREVQK